MAKKCANCGNPMIETHSKLGLRFLICRYVKVRTIKTLEGTPTRDVYLYCNLNIKGLRATFENLTKNTKLTLEALRNATKKTVSDSVLLEQANLALTLGLPANELETLFKSAFDLGLSLGLTPQKAIESLVKGIGRESTKILDNLGIIFKRSEAYAWYQQQTGKTKLEATHKREAFTRYAIEQIKRKAQRLR